MTVKKSDNKAVIVIDPKNVTVIQDNNKDKTYAPWDMAEALRLRIVKHRTYKELEDYYGISDSTIHLRLKRFKAILDVTANVDTISNMKSQLLTLVEWTMLQDALDKGKRKSASLNNTAYAFGVFHKANQLEQNKPTDIVDMRRITADLKDFLDRTDEE